MPDRISSLGIHHPVYVSFNLTPLTFQSFLVLSIWISNPGLWFQVAHNLQLEGVWRQLHCLDNSTAFAVRQQCGHTLKSSIRYHQRCSVIEGGLLFRRIIALLIFIVISDTSLQLTDGTIQFFPRRVPNFV